MLNKLSEDPAYSVMASCGEDMEAVKKCLIVGYFDHAAQLGADGKYYTVRGKARVGIHYTSVLSRFGAPPEWVLFNDIVYLKEPLIRDVTRIEPRWLLDIAPHYYTLNKKQ